MSALWTGAELAEALGVSVPDIALTGVSIDTRTLQPGDLFIALKDQRDGHDFLTAAIKAGASAALVSRAVDGVNADKLILVPDVLASLNQLARFARARSAARVIAVTGSVGKTGTKDMLRHMLAAQGRVHAAEKSYNNHWGVPLTLARLPREADFAVIEIGMNHPGEIAPLSQLARPHVAMITTVAAVHAEAFSGVEAIADEKAAIFEGLEAQGVAVLPRDNAHYERLKRATSATVVAFGEHEASTFRMTRAHVSPTATVVEASSPDGPFMFKLGAPGLHLAMNALGALAAAHAAGADLARAALALAQWRAPEGRGAQYCIAFGPSGLDGQLTLIDESYNANPASMGAALALLALSPVENGIGRVANGRRIAVLGDMLELGPDELALHAGLAAHSALTKIHKVHCIGARMKALHTALPFERRGQWFADSSECAAQIGRMLDAGDVVMAKGSFGSRLAVVVDAIKNLGECSPLNTGEGE